MAPPAMSTFEPDTKYRLLLRVEAAEDLAHKSAQGAYCKLFVGDAALLDGSQSKLLKADGDEQEHHHVFRTQTRTATAPGSTGSGKSETRWDETFEVSLRDPATELLSLRVKSQHRFFCPVVGTFAVHLRHLRVGLQADQWFPLRRGKKEVGRIRLHLLVTPEHAPPPGRAKKRNGSDMAPDVKVALAASFEADRAIQRLVNKQLRDEEERRQRRQNGGDEEDAATALDKHMDKLVITRANEPRFPVLRSLSPTSRPPSSQADAPITSPASGSRGPVESGQSVQPHSAFFGATGSRSGAHSADSSTRLSDLERERRRAANFAHLKDLDAVASPSVEVGVPVGSGRGSSRRRSLPNHLGDDHDGNQRPHAMYSIPSFGPDEFEKRRDKRHSAGSSTDSDSLAEYERRLDRKLRKVRKETEKLCKIRRQLRKYIPDLSDSEDESSSSSSSGDNQQRRRGSSRHRGSAAPKPTDPQPSRGSSRGAVSSSRFYV